MKTGFTSADILKEARRRVFKHAILRPEAAVIIALTVVSTAFALFDFILPFQIWWAFLALGAAGCVVLVYTTLNDEKFIGQISAQMFYERFDAGKFGTPELRRHMIRALDYHRQIFRTIRARPSAPLGDVARNMDEWIVRVYSVARDVDSFVKNPLIVERMKRLSDGGPRNAEANDSLSLILAHEDAPVESGEEYSLFGEVKKAMLGAATEIDGSLRGMSQVHQRLHATHPGDIDWAFAQHMNVMICDHLMRLEQAGSLVQELFSTYLVPQASDEY